MQKLNYVIISNTQKKENELREKLVKFCKSHTDIYIYDGNDQYILLSPKIMDNIAFYGIDEWKLYSTNFENIFMYYPTSDNVILMKGNIQKHCFDVSEAFYFKVKNYFVRI